MSVHTKYAVYIRYALTPEAAVFVAISHENRDPLYKQVTDQLRDAIAKGTLAPGAKLPSIRGMAEELALSPITIRRAYADLERGGYIVTRAGLGSFVAGISRDRLREEKVREIRGEIGRIVKAAEAFGVSIGEIRRMVGQMKAGRR
jgi:GntR family transcriptional regulator